MLGKGAGPAASRHYPVVGNRVLLGAALHPHLGVPIYPHLVPTGG